MVFLLGSTACNGAANTPGVAERLETLARFSNIPQRGIVLGDARAPVTLTIFVDFQCPFCRDFAHQVEPTLIEGFLLGKTGEVPTVFKPERLTPEVFARALDALLPSG